VPISNSDPKFPSSPPPIPTMILCAVCVVVRTQGFPARWMAAARLGSLPALQAVDCWLPLASSLSCVLPELLPPLSVSEWMACLAPRPLFSPSYLHPSLPRPRGKSEIYPCRPVDTPLLYTFPSSKISV
jgi:hypothetical protein